ncbi:uncharacterized protein LOC131153979 [Malania oleifera]|uniref:uncharacterized protein LOC131153979 n=1 Tax=Malania oleifera TaxID=397392 RepID=UPI0025AE70B7|nr:uncharacterized protein LOC131153979 [Malania oleifera]
MEEFNTCLDNCGLMDLVVSSSNMSWCNGHNGHSRSWAKLDRVLYNLTFLQSLANIYFEYGNRRTSDHKPLIIWFHRDLHRYGPSPFRYQNMSRTHLSFKSCVEEAWREEFLGTSFVRLADKLKHTKVTIRNWNKQVFGHVHQNIKKMEESMEVLEAQLQEGYLLEIEENFFLSKLELGA